MKIKRSHIELHVHPFFDRYGLEDVLNAMGRRGIDIIALEQLNGRVFDGLSGQIKGLKQKGYEADSDNIAVKIKREEDGKEFYILRAAELQTKDDFHIITIGSDDIKPMNHSHKMVYEANNGGSIVILDHPFVDIHDVRRTITKGQQYKIKELLEFNHLFLEWNGYCIPWVRKMLGGDDVNKMAFELSESQLRKGNSAYMLADTDVHARTKASLDTIGTARVIADINVESGREIIDSLRREIINGRHENVLRTVPVYQFARDFGLPYVFGRMVERPRG